ncbi:hypothetical protein [Azonexus sp. R2A61]|uniref:hypothetical protein n=1 Tax=Azonexus sp. R2A61 TaxID=2744443 RepID=UPI001F321CE8|nr:hypothetical protein [Azonexus sp. R2A61]
MLPGVMVLAGFIGAWVGFAIAGKRRGWSITEYVGGGFLIAVVVLAILGAAAMFLTRAPLPPSIAAAGLTGETWSDNDVKLAARITANNLHDIESQLLDADKRGDAAAAVKLLDPLIEIMRAWGDQQYNPAAAPYRNCVLAAGHLSDGVSAVGTGGRYFVQDRFQAALKACPT